MAWYGNWRPYVPVAKRRANAAAYAKKLARDENRQLSPVNIAGRKIATTFWGIEWCNNLERYSDFANRLPRGANYVRNGSVIDLQISKGTIQALVSGSSIYKVKITIDTLEKVKWNRIKSDCSQSIDSLIDLLQGKFDQGIMRRLTQREEGLFPRPKEIKMSCSCPDWAGMCKHIAATMYGVGARLDNAPELLFVLRAVDHLELINQAVTSGNVERSLTGSPDGTLETSALGELFGIEIDSATPEAKSSKRKASRTRASTTTTTAAKTPAPKKNSARRPAKKLPPAVATTHAKRTSSKSPAGGAAARQKAR